MEKNYLTRLRKGLTTFLAVLAALAVWGAARQPAYNRAKAEFFQRQASKLEAMDKNATAAYYLQRASSLAPDDAYVRYRLGMYMQDDSVGLDMMREYAETHLNDPYIAVPYITALYKAGEVEKIFPILDNLERILPEDQEILDLDINVSRQTDSVARQMRIADRLELLGADPMQAALYRAQAMTSQEPEDTLGLLRVLDEFVETHPDNDEGIVMRALAYAGAGRDSIAAVWLEEKAASTPDNYRFRSQLARIYASAYDSVNVRKSLLKALDSEDLDLADYCGILLSLPEDQATELLEATEKRFPTDSTVISTLFSKALNEADTAAMREYAGRLPTSKQNSTKVVSMYTALQNGNPAKALEIYRSYPGGSETEDQTVESMLPVIYAQLGDKENFLPLRDKALREALPGVENIDSLPPFDYAMYYPDAQSAYDMYLLEAELYNKTGDLDGTIRASRNAMALSTWRNRALALNNYAYFIATMSSDPELLDQALAMAKESVALGADINNIDTLAWILHLKGEDEKALSFFEPMLRDIDTDLLNKEFFDHIEAMYKAVGRDGTAVLSRWKEK